jgi:uncharacterized repeat protein (TIGR03809 family)
MIPGLNPLAKTAQRWRALAEERRDYFHELRRNGRWARFFSEEEFLRLLQESERNVVLWSEISPAAPSVTAPDAGGPPAEASQIAPVAAAVHRGAA